MLACPACGTENVDVARFCMNCGTALPRAATPGREARKTVTVVFADIVGSTGLGEHLDPESVRSITGRWFEAMRGVLEAHGGSVEKFIGDAVVAVFGVPVVHEDDALRAVRAVVDMRRALATLNEMLRSERGLELQMRVGVNTGPVVVGDARAGGSRATGDTVNVAARLQSAAEPGEILVGDSTWRLVRDAVETGDSREISVKGRDQPVVVRALRAVARARHVHAKGLRERPASRRATGTRIGAGRRPYPISRLRRSTKASRASATPGSSGGGSYSARSCFQIRFARSVAVRAPSSCHVSKLRQSDSIGW
jgi:class 3 adenylate cyclase